MRSLCLLAASEMHRSSLQNGMASISPDSHLQVWPPYDCWRAFGQAVSSCDISKRNLFLFKMAFHASSLRVQKRRLLRGRSRRSSRRLRWTRSRRDCRAARRRSPIGMLRWRPCNRHGTLFSCCAPRRSALLGIEDASLVQQNLDWICHSMNKPASNVAGGKRVSSCRSSQGGRRRLEKLRQA